MLSSTANASVGRIVNNIKVVNTLAKILFFISYLSF